MKFIGANMRTPISFRNTYQYLVSTKRAMLSWASNAILSCGSRKIDSTSFEPKKGNISMFPINDNCNMINIKCNRSNMVNEYEFITK